MSEHTYQVPSRAWGETIDRILVMPSSLDPEFGSRNLTWFARNVVRLLPPEADEEASIAWACLPCWSRDHHGEIQERALNAIRWRRAEVGVWPVRAGDGLP